MESDGAVIGVGGFSKSRPVVVFCSLLLPFVSFVFSVRAHWRRLSATLPGIPNSSAELVSLIQCGFHFLEVDGPVDDFI
jgi:hypothetical protein